MKIASAKAKGRRAAQQVVQLLYKFWPKGRPGDIEVTSSSVTGEDVKLSPAARVVYPFVIEVKNQEALNIWAAYTQAEAHLAGKATDESLIPVVFFKRNKSKLMACMEAEQFVKMAARRPVSESMPEFIEDTVEGGAIHYD